MDSPRPFRIDIPAEDVERMKRLISDTRLPERPFTNGVSWNYGADLDWLKGLRTTWLDSFDWKRVEAEMNEFTHFKVTIEGVDLHYLYQRSDRADATPLIMLHGWPGSSTFWA
jgi:hypothetical protein